jgi:hypothetical protein
MSDFNTFTLQLVSIWDKFTDYWYRPNQHFADDINEPTITNFMEWVQDNYNE